MAFMCAMLQSGSTLQRDMQGYPVSQCFHARYDPMGETGRNCCQNEKKSLPIKYQEFLCLSKPIILHETKNKVKLMIPKIFMLHHLKVVSASLKRVCT